MTSLKHYDIKAKMLMRFVIKNVCRSTSENTKAFPGIHAICREKIPIQVYVFLLTQILK